TVRYWFTDVDTAVSQFNCDWAAIGCQHVTGVWESVDGRQYLEVRFNTGATMLPAGGQTGEIQLRLHHTNWSAYNEADDYSFAPALTSLTDWQNVTLYHNGQLVWGIEP
ncbi:MAG: glycoside hydrolase family 9, partial [Anaerolineae bacterium]|nr:glycoside hydrolase family 9 [Anaerolineae bacterium]